MHFALDRFSFNGIHVIYFIDKLHPVNFLAFSKQMRVYRCQLQQFGSV